jgi:hypothetical protein
MIGLWPLAYITFMLFFNLSEGFILKQDNLFLVLYMATSVFIINQVKHLLPELTQARAHVGAPLKGEYVPLGSAKESMGT